MTITEILLLIGVAILYRLLGATTRIAPIRGWILLTLSTLAIFWLQPAMPIRFLDFWLPVLTVSITILSWLLTEEKAEKLNRKNIITIAYIFLLILLVALTRFLSLDGLITANRPPQTQQVIIGLLILLGLVAIFVWLGRNSNKWLGIGILLILVIFIFLKLPALTLWLSSVLRDLVGQSGANASPLDIRWLGFSYVAFRLIHTLRDRQAGRLPAVSLQNYVNYIIFFPAISAGPIDKLPRFDKDFQTPLQLNSEVFGSAFSRLMVGLFKKFALADTLGLIALNSQNATQLQANGWGWIIVYAYTFQIFLDFSGYTDIAIGLGKLMGIQLPENFNRPYLRPNLTQFWNNWHMTLTQWIRAYFFNPFTRSLRSKYRNLSPTWVILITQLSTMIIIGFWHGITWNFVLWGTWHGLGMFVQNRYSDWVKPRLIQIEDKPILQKGMMMFNVLLTFHFVALGWVWFALPDVSLSINVFMQLLGIGV